MLLRFKKTEKEKNLSTLQNIQSWTGQFFLYSQHLGVLPPNREAY